MTDKSRIVTQQKYTKEQSEQCFGCDIEEFRKSIEESIAWKTGGPSMEAVSILSDVQEMIHIVEKNILPGMPISDQADGYKYLNKIRQEINKAKWMITEYMIQKTESRKPPYDFSDVPFTKRPEIILEEKNAPDLKVHEELPSSGPFKNRNNTDLIGYLGVYFKNFVVLCLNCVKNSDFIPLPYKITKTRVSHANIGDYSQHCAHCGELLHEGKTPAWPEMFDGKRR